MRGLYYQLEFFYDVYPGGGRYSLILSTQVYAALKGIGFSAVLVINRVLILAILVINRVWFLPSNFDMDMFLKRSHFLSLWQRPSKEAFHKSCLKHWSVLGNYDKAGLKHSLDLTVRF